MFLSSLVHARTRTLCVRRHVRSRLRSTSMEKNTDRGVLTARGHTHAPNRGNHTLVISSSQGKAGLDKVLECTIAWPVDVGGEVVDREDLSLQPKHSVGAVHLDVSLHV